MTIKWNANKVSEALDKVEQQINLAESFFGEAIKKANEARLIPDLPQYIDQRIGSLIDQIKRIDNVKSAIKAVRKDIPKGEIERWRKRDSTGTTGSLFAG